MSIRVMTAVWDLDLPDSEKIVLLALADCANDEGHCWPSMASLSRKCSKGERTIQGAVKSLCEKGHLTRREVVGKGCNYTVHPRAKCAPAETAPPQRTTKTPAAAADKPSRTVIKKTQSAHLHELPDDWEPRPFGQSTKTQAVIETWPEGEFETQLEHFRAHHRAKGSKFKDWQDAWSTWALNSRKFGGRNGQRSENRTPEEPRNSVVRAAMRSKAERAAGEFHGHGFGAGGGAEDGGSALAVSDGWH